METGLTEARFAENRAQSVGELDRTHHVSAAAPDQHDSSLPAWMALALSVEDASRGPGGTPLSPERAQQLTVELRRYPRAVDRDGFVQMLRRAFEGNAHGVLAFDSWHAFVLSLQLDESVPSILKEMPCHPAAELFPMLDGGDFAQLVDDMRMHGQRVPIITTSDGRILDGRHRARACQHLGLDPVTEVYAGDDPVAFVVSANLRRRHLTDSQRAMIAARLATLGQGKPATLPVKPPTQAEAAARLDVSERSVRDAAKVRREGSPELVAAVERGEVPVSRAARDVRARGSANTDARSASAALSPTARKSTPEQKLPPKSSSVDGAIHLVAAAADSGKPADEIMRLASRARMLLDNCSKTISADALRRCVGDLLEAVKTLAERVS